MSTCTHILVISGVVSLASRLPIYVNHCESEFMTVAGTAFCFPGFHSFWVARHFEHGESLHYFEEFLFRTRTVNPWVSVHPSCSFHGMSPLQFFTTVERFPVILVFAICEFLWTGVDRQNCDDHRSQLIFFMFIRTFSLVLNHLLHIACKSSQRWDGLV